MSLSVGIIGLPNVGKSTLFNALLKRSQALVANYPFATIEPNVGVVPVPDERLERLAEVVAGSSNQVIKQSSNLGGKESEPVEITPPDPLFSKEGEVTGVRLPPVVPASVQFVDIAGLVAGAHKGEGLGNQFLAHIREVDLIALVLRDFDDGEVVVTGEGVVEDYQTLVSELILKDSETVENKNRNSKSPKSSATGQAEIRNNPKYLNVLNKLAAGFEEGKRAIEVLREEEVDDVRELTLLTMKPVVVVVNVDEIELENRARESGRVSYAERLGVSVEDVVVVSAKIESEIATLNESDGRVFMDDLGVEESGLERLIGSAYERLGLISFLTAPSFAKATEGQGGKYEVRAWTVKNGTEAVRAAGVIHSDFMNKFIKAEVVGFDDFVEFGGWKRCRELGKVRLEGRGYVVQDGDVVDFKIGT